MVPLKLRPSDHSEDPPLSPFYRNGKRKGSTCAHAFFPSARKLQRRKRFLRLTPTAASLGKLFFAPFSSTPLLDDTTRTGKSQDAKAELFDFFVRFFRFSLCALENAGKMIYNERRKGSENVHRAFTYGCYTQKRLRSYNA